jgi:hypothetical protein
MKIWTVEEIKNLLETDDQFVCRAIVKIFEKQTEDEKASDMTDCNNGVGFNGTDAFIMSQYAKFFMEKKYLTPKQLAIAKRKIMKYAKQLTRIANEGKEPVKKPVSSDSMENLLSGVELDLYLQLKHKAIVTDTKTGVTRNMLPKLTVSDIKEFNLTGSETPKQIEVMANDFMSDIFSDYCDDMAARKRGDYDYIDDYDN